MRIYDYLKINRQKRKKEKEYIRPASGRNGKIKLLFLLKSQQLKVKESNGKKKRNAKRIYMLQLILSPPPPPPL